MAALSGKLSQLSPEVRQYVEDLVNRLLSQGEMSWPPPGDRSVLEQHYVTPARHRSPWRWLGPLLILLVAAATGGAALVISQGREDKTPAIAGHFLLKDPKVRTPGAECAGSGGYDDIHAGAQVRVTNEDGKVLGVSALGSGTPAGLYCSFSFTVDPLPKASVYSFEVSRRGQISYTAKQLETALWMVELSLG